MPIGMDTAMRGGEREASVRVSVQFDQTARLLIDTRFSWKSSTTKLRWADDKSTQPE